MTMMQQVVTHQGRAGSLVDLCDEHEDTYREYIGVDYHGVSRGAHWGECEECLRLRELSAETTKADRSRCDALRG
jgi:hypothetical protein